MLAATTPISLASALGLSAVGALYTLHHLRTRPTRRAVATLIFWKQTTRKQQARALWSRQFTHRRTFALLSLIALILASALSADRWTRGENNAIVIVDVGSSMAAAGADGRTILQNVIDAARQDCNGLPSSPALLAAGTGPTVLCKADQPLRVFNDQLTQLAPTTQASNPALAMELAFSMLEGRAGTIDWYSDRSTLPAGLPTEIARRVRLRRKISPPQTVAITGAVFEPNKERPSEGTLRIRLSGHCDHELTLNTTIGGLLRPQRIMPIAERADILIDHLATDGQTVTLNLPDAPGSPAEHSAQFELPRHFSPHFFLVGEIPKPLRAALAAIGTETSSPQGAIVVAPQGEALPAGAIGSIVLVNAGSTAPARLLTTSASVPISLASIDFEGATLNASQSVPSAATPLLQADSITAAGFQTTPVGPRLYLSMALVDDAADLPRRAAFPVLIERLIGEIAGWHAASLVESAQRIALDPLWFQKRSAAPATMVVFDSPLMNFAGSTPAAAPPPLARTLSNWPWALVLLLLGFILLTAEGILLARKKIV